MEDIEVSFSRGAPSTWDLHFNVQVQRGSVRETLGEAALNLAPLCAAAGVSRALSLPLDTGFGGAHATLRVIARMDDAASWAPGVPSLRDGAGRTASDVSDASLDWTAVGSDENGTVTPRTSRFAAMFGGGKRPRTPNERSSPAKASRWWHWRSRSGNASLLSSQSASPEPQSPAPGVAVPVTPENSASSAEVDLFRAQLLAALASSAAMAQGEHTPGAVTLTPGSGFWSRMEVALPADELDGDGACVNAEVCFGTFDQRSVMAGGASACAVLAVANAAWLHSRPDKLPTTPKLDELMRRGCAAWRVLCTKPAAGAFPGGRFDLAAALAAPPAMSSLPRLELAPGGSFVAFLQPPGCLPGVCATLDAMQEAAASLEACLEAGSHAAPAAAVLSMLDHHVALRFETNGSVLLVDTLGDRLFEGNTRSYVLRCTSARDLARLLTETVAAPRLTALGAKLAAGEQLPPAQLCAQLQVDLHLLCAA